MTQTLSAQALIAEIRAALEDKKAEKVVALDLREASDSLDYFVIATGTSQPHLQALERAVRERLEGEGIRANKVEGPSPRWVLLDYGEVLVHLMSPEARDYYDLEGFWADAKRI
ncbi:ribosome silencing factor [Meiothermus granaticius]|uniref:Ribosomal silencing factor RsfS n=1 Tax=Meiothermus granaticius NBRC 107808 TaxID=1227551 RepID=A0A399F883_9DEIN|nr:ribosome silencing factor [Meiothermus granaticius]MCL6526503.1 ribosome silencing factor [Thermaceae bacterium]RIH92874.1 Ribosomal silencing factor RsfS [Meiothermus granaticius NBRC 107808]GEM86730.1 ribosomal silencing factor RsfS [Meiothermus granaticius NBRC 107808]